MSSKLVGFIGAAGTGKTTLACSLKEYFMLNNVSTDVCTEYAREFVFEYGFPTHPAEQFRLGIKQKTREDLLCKGNNKYIFSDSPVWLTYIYSFLIINNEDNWQRQSIISDIYREFVISNIHRYHRVYYLKNNQPFNDGCKRDLKSEMKVREIIDGFVLMHKGILPIIEIISPINNVEERKKFVLSDLEGNS